jgi:hypothetical protein
MPATDLWATTDGSPAISRFFGQLYSESGAPSVMLFGQNGGWQLPTVYGAVVSYDELATYNLAAYLLYAPSSYFTADQTIAEIRRLAGNFLYAAVGVNGISQPDVAPDNPAIPIFVGANSFATTSHSGIGKSSVTRSPTSDVTFVETTDSRLTTFFNITAYGASTANTAAQNATAIAAAVTAASAVNSGIYVPVGTFFTNSVTISVPITFEPGISVLEPDNGQTITITKSVEADLSQHFSNADSGHGTISFAGNSTLSSIPPQWWGMRASTTALVNSSKIHTAVAAAITANTGISISAGLFFVNDLTISVPLELAPGAILSAGVGRTITITKSISANVAQHFAGLGTVSFVGNSSQKDFEVAWWGADSAASGAATSTALNAAFAAWPDGATMHLSPHVVYTHAGITIDRKFASTLLGVDTLDGYLDAVTAPKFVYSGTDGGDAITISNCFAVTFRGFGSWGAVTNTVPGTTGAAKNLYVTMTPGGYPPISSQNVFQSVFLYAASTRADYISVDVDNATGVNNEFHQFNDCIIVGGTDVFGNIVGTGLHLGHANAKQIKINRTTFGSLAKAIDSHGGNFRGFGNTYGNCGVVYSGRFTDAVVDVGSDSESCVQIIDAEGSGNQPFTLIAGRFDAIRGGAVSASASRTTDHVVRYTTRLTLIGCTFGAWNETGNNSFSNHFIDGTDGVSAVGTLKWINSSVGGDGGPIPLLNFTQGLGTFARYDVDSDDYGPLQGSAVNAVQRSYTGLSTSGSIRDLLGVESTDSSVFGTGRVAAFDSTVIGPSAEIEIAGFAAPQRPDVSYAGANDAALNLSSLAVIARDALGNRTMPSVINQNVHGNTTLSGSNYIRVTWPAVKWNQVTATDYLLLQFSGGWRIIATVTPSGTATEHYDIIANPAGAFTYVIPTYNETAAVKTRGALVAPIERAFTSLDTSPSVIGSSDFVTANAGATSITTLDNGITGQAVYVRINDANTTFVNGSGIITTTGSNVAATNGRIYAFKYRGGNWIQL